MVEKFKRPAPDGNQLFTWYHLSRQEAQSLVEREIVPLEQGRTIDDVEDSDVMALPGEEAKVEALIRSWGLEISSIGKG